MNNSNICRKQHYIPKMFLKGFSSKNKINVYTKEKNYTSSIINCCEERDFYKLDEHDNAIDIKITDIESNTIQTNLNFLRNTTNKENVDCRIAIEIIEHFSYRGNYLFKVPSIINKKATDKIKKLLTRNMFNVDVHLFDGNIKLLGKLLNDLVLKELYGNLYNGSDVDFFSILSEYKWKIVESVNNNFFILPDTLILCRDRKSGAINPFVQQISYKLKELEKTIIFPISNTKLLIGSNIIYSDEFIIKNFNRWASLCSFEKFYANPSFGAKKYKPNIGKSIKSVIDRNVSVIVNSFKEGESFNYTAKMGFQPN